MVLVGMGDRRVHDEAAVADPVALAQRRRVGDGVRRGRVEPVGHDHDGVGVDPERIDHRRPHVLARHGHDRGAAHGSRHRDLEVAALDGGEVRRVGAVLQVVHGQHDRVRGTQRNGAATVVDDVGADELAGQPRRLHDDSPAAAAGVQRGDHQLVAGGDVAMGRGEPGQHEQPGGDPGLGLVQADELTGQVLLGAADLARQAPQQVHPDDELGHRVNRRIDASERSASERAASNCAGGMWRGRGTQS